MDCLAFQRCLDDLLAGSATRELQAAGERHRLGCPGCREQWDLRSGSPELQPPDGLVASILARTSGAACGRARELLGDTVDGTAERADAELVRLHLTGCGECEALSAVLARLTEDLPQLAELEPDASFAHDVVRATTGVRRRPAAARSGWLGFLLDRPRIAWEGAYIGSLALALVFGTPASPLAGAPRKALELASSNPVAGIKEPLRRLESEVSAGLRSTWAATGAGVAGRTREVAADLSAKSQATLGKLDLERIKSGIGTLRTRLTSWDTTDEQPLPADDERPGDETNQGDER